MKFKQTKNLNYKLTLSEYELSVFYAVLQHVRLGNGLNSEVVFDFLNHTEDLGIGDIAPGVTIDVVVDANSKEQEFTINV